MKHDSHVSSTGWGKRQPTHLDGPVDLILQVMYQQPPDTSMIRVVEEIPVKTWTGWNKCMRVGTSMCAYVYVCMHVSACSCVYA